MTTAQYEWHPEDNIAVIHCPPELNATFFAEARSFILSLGVEPLDVVIDDGRVIEMPPDFVDNASTIGVVAYPGVRRVAFCNIPPGWQFPLEATNKLATGNAARVTFHTDVAAAYAFLKMKALETQK